MVSLDALKGGLVAGLFCITFVASIIPIGLRLAARARHYSIDAPHATPSGYKFMMAFSFLSCYGGGIFLSTCLLDLFPSCQKTLHAGMKQMKWNSSFPLPEFMVTIGFILILFSEQLGLWWKENSPHDDFSLAPGHSHNPGGQPRPRTQTPTHDHERTGPFATLGSIRRQTVTSEPPLVPIIEVSPPDSPNGDVSREVTLDVTIDDDATSNGDVTLAPEVRPRVRRSSTIRAHFDPNTHSTLRSILLVTALSFHAFFEGMALGLQSDREDIWTLFAALCIHKSLVAFSMGLRLVQSRLSNVTVALCCAIFCSMNVLGAVFGIVLEDNVSSARGQVAGGVLRGIACGTFLYVTFFEILPHELNPSGFRLGKLLTLTLGVATVCVVFLVFPDA